MNQTSHLPLKLNMSGVIPPIFASSLIMFPATAATWFSQRERRPTGCRCVSAGARPGRAAAHAPVRAC